MSESNNTKGHLAQIYSRNQFNICQEKLISKEDISDATINVNVPGNSSFLTLRGSKYATVKKNTSQQSVIA